MRTTAKRMPKNSSRYGPSTIEPKSSANPLIATRRAMAMRSSEVRLAVMLKKNGADLIGLTIGRSPAKVRRKALRMPLMNCPRPAASRGLLRERCAARRPQLTTAQAP
jgi:hypothetical protein